jgi:hypothetical protein
LRWAFVLRIEQYRPSSLALQTQPERAQLVAPATPPMQRGNIASCPLVSEGAVLLLQPQAPPPPRAALFTPFSHPCVTFRARAGAQWARALGLPLRRRRQQHVCAPFTRPLDFGRGARATEHAALVIVFSRPTTQLSSDASQLPLPRVHIHTAASDGLCFWRGSTTWVCLGVRRPGPVFPVCPGWPGLPLFALWYQPMRGRLVCGLGPSVVSRAVRIDGGCCGAEAAGGCPSLGEQCKRTLACGVAASICVCQNIAALRGAKVPRATSRHNLLRSTSAGSTTRGVTGD